MVDLHVTSRDVAYLLGSVGGMLLQPGLSTAHRDALVNLRDRLARLIPLDEALRSALGLAVPEPVS